MNRENTLDVPIEIRRVRDFFAFKGSFDNFYKYRGKIPRRNSFMGWCYHEVNCYFVDYRAIFQEFCNFLSKKQRAKLSLSHRSVRLILVTYVICQCRQNKYVRLSERLTWDFKHIFVDEFHDLSEVELFCLRQISRGGATFA